VRVHRFVETLAKLRRETVRSLHFETLEKRLLMAVTFIGPLSKGEWGVTTQDVNVTAVAAGNTEAGGLSVRFRLDPGGPDPVGMIVQVEGDAGDGGSRQPEFRLIAPSSMLQSKQQFMTIDGVTDFAIEAEPGARYLIFSVSVRDQNWLNNGLSVGQRVDKSFVSIDLTSAIADIANGVTSPGRRDLSVPDINGDGFVSPLDALSVINYLNEGISAPEGAGTIFLEPQDVNADGIVSALDALLVINVLNRDAAFAAYGEAP
jgi:hypothetical protein